MGVVVCLDFGVVECGELYSECFDIFGCIDY